LRNCDDRPEVAALARSILEDFGYHTRLAPNANKALDILDSSTRSDLLFTDLVMPAA
jgi:CheY-like chemotaxis protein